MPSTSDEINSLLKVDINGPEFTSLVNYLVKKGVAITSTLPVFETFTPGRRVAPSGELDAMLPEAREQYLRRWSLIASHPNSPWVEMFKKGMQMEKKFYDAGGLLLVGTDPTGYGGVVAGYSNSRAIELLVEEGLSPVEAIKVATLNGAKYIGKDKEIGTIATGKIADLVVVEGDPSENIKDIEKVETVFKNGIGYDSQKLFDSVKGTVGLN